MARQRLNRRLAALEARAESPAGLQPIEFIEIVCDDDWPRPDPATLPPHRSGTIRWQYLWRNEVIINEQQS